MEDTRNIYFNSSCFLLSASDIDTLNMVISWRNSDKLTFKLSCLKGCLWRHNSTQLNSTELNSTDPVEQRTAKSVVFLFMTSWPTNWVNWVTTFIDRWQLFTLWTCRQLDVELSWVELRRRCYRHFADATQLNSSCRHVHSVNNCHLSMNVVTQLTQFVGHDVINENTTDLAVRCSSGSVELSWVELSWVVSL